MILRSHRSRFVGFVLLASLSACSKDEPAPVRAAVPAAAASAQAGQKRFVITSGSGADFLIDAPLEKIKGHSGKVRGTLDVDLDNLQASKGMIEVDLDDLQTQTFDDAEKNKTQTGHAHNWLEIGPDVEAKRREENRWARFTIQSLDRVSATKLADVAVKDGQKAVEVSATGDLWIHGVSSPQSVKVNALFGGADPANPTTLQLITSEPVRSSLQQHDIKPRDLAGKFLAGALEKVGQKIDDNVQISLDLKAAK